MRSYFIVPLFFCAVFFNNPVSAGVGCQYPVGNPAVDIVYTSEFGDVQFFSSKYKEYNENGAQIRVSYQNPTPCGEINGFTKTGYSRAGYVGCWINTFYNSPNNQDNVKFGAWVQFNDPVECSIDTGVFIVFILSAVVGILFIYK